MVRVYSEEIAAFYDPKTKTMHLIKEPPVAEAKKPGFLESLLGGKKAGFDKDENKTVIAHELTHALADQNYDLDKMQKAVEADDDRSLALSSLIEGEATLAMIGAQMDDWDGSKVGAIPAADLDRTFSLMMPFMSMAGGASLREAPPILSESLIFPYLRGMVFCASLTNEGGWKALNEAYENPPQSTEQILHPEKYRDQPDPPTDGRPRPARAGRGLGRGRPERDRRDAARRPAPQPRRQADRRRLGRRPLRRLRGQGRQARPSSGSPPGTPRTTPATSPASTPGSRRPRWAKGVASPDAFPDAIRRPHDGDVYAVERRGQGRRRRRRLRRRGHRTAPRGRLQGRKKRAGADQARSECDDEPESSTDSLGHRPSVIAVDLPISRRVESRSIPFSSADRNRPKSGSSSWASSGCSASPRLSWRRRACRRPA